MEPVGFGALIAGLTILTYKTQTKMKKVINQRKLIKKSKGDDEKTRQRNIEK